MADEVDRANAYMEEALERAIAEARGDIPAGEPGYCELCGEHSGRLIKGVCAPCRDRYGLE